MASQTSNLGAVTGSLNGLSQSLNLLRRIAGGKALGTELIEVAASAIEERSVNKQVDPDGNPWAALKPRTLARKRKLGLDSRINIATHEMLDPQQIQGRTNVTRDSATMQAGLDAETIAKVGYAEEGGPNRPERPFYELGKDGEAAVDVLVKEVLDKAVRGANNF